MELHEALFEKLSQGTSGSSVMPDKSSAVVGDHVSACASEIVMMDVRTRQRDTFKTNVLC